MKNPMHPNSRGTDFVENEVRAFDDESVRLGFQPRIAWTSATIWEIAEGFDPIEDRFDHLHRTARRVFGNVLVDLLKVVLSPSEDPDGMGH